jgi:hypothetical protein
VGTLVAFTVASDRKATAAKSGISKKCYTEKTKQGSPCGEPCFLEWALNGSVNRVVADVVVTWPPVRCKDKIVDYPQTNIKKSRAAQTGVD